jgi:hypothetical protein
VESKDFARKLAQEREHMLFRSISHSSACKEKHVDRWGLHGALYRPSEVGR